MNIRTFHGITLYALILFCIVACQKDDKVTDSPEDRQEFATATSASDADAQIIFDDVLENVVGVNSEVAIGGTGVFAPNVAHESGSGPLSVEGDSAKCYVLTVTHLNENEFFPAKVEIDFGAGCTGHDGITRKGKIIIVYSKHLILPGATATTTFDGYYVDGIHVEGTHLITNNSSANGLALSVKVTNAKLTFENGNYTEWNTEKNWIQSQGFGTVQPSDDIFELSGSSNGSTKRGEKFYQWTAATTTPLVKKFTCKHIVQGSITFSKNNSGTAVLDYGDGSCDNKATLTAGNWSLEITLR